VPKAKKERGRKGGQLAGGPIIPVKYGRPGGRHRRVDAARQIARKKKGAVKSGARQMLSLNLVRKGRDEVRKK